MFFSAAMASYPITFVGRDSHLDLVAPSAEMKTFNDALNDQTARDRALNWFDFHPLADTPYPNYVSSSMTGRCFDKTVEKLGSSRAGKVLRKLGRRRERIASVRVDADMRKKAKEYAAQHTETNLANKRKAEALQAERRRKLALEREQVAAVSNVTSASVSVQELAKISKERDSDEEHNASEPPKAGHLLQTEVSPTVECVAGEVASIPYAKRESQHVKLQPLEKETDPESDPSSSTEIETTRLGGCGRIAPRFDMDVADILSDTNVEIAVGEAMGAVRVLRMALINSAKRSADGREELEKLKPFIFSDM